MRNLLLTLALFMLGTFTIQAQTIMNIYLSDGSVIQVPVNTIDSINFTITNPGSLATLTTNSADWISGTQANSGGIISSDGGSAITQRGIVWSTSPNPTTADNMATNGAGIGTFIITMTGLTPATTYYVRAFAINSAGTAYGNEISFTSNPNLPIVSSPGAGVTMDGYTYPSLVYGNGQEWMTENLRTAVYANGDPIPNETNGAQWVLDTNIGVWSFFNNDSQNENPYGKLYNWYASADPRNVCPTGWHVPHDTDWAAFIYYLGGEPVAGGKMKVPGTQYWNSPNTGATNESGFSSVAGGERSVNSGSFVGLKQGCFYWSSGLYPHFNGLLIPHNTGFEWYGEFADYAGTGAKSHGISIRCLKD